MRTRSAAFVAALVATLASRAGRAQDAAVPDDAASTVDATSAVAVASDAGAPEEPSASPDAAPPPDTAATNAADAAVALAVDAAIPPAASIDAAAPPSASIDAALLDAADASMSLSAPDAAVLEAPRRPLLLAVSDDIDGQFAVLDCNPGERQPALVSVASQLAGAPADALRLDVGNLVGAAAASRRALRADPAAFADTIAHMGLAALAVSDGDLSAPRDVLVHAAAALRAHAIPYVLTNLTCDPAAADVCAAVVHEGEDPVILETPRGKVAYVAALDPAALHTIAHDRARGLTLHEPHTVLAAAVARARALGADYVVAAFNPVWGNGLRDALTLARALTEEGAPDVLLVSGIGGEVGSLQPPGGRTLVVGTRAEGVVLVEPGTLQPVRTPSWVQGSTAVVDYARGLAQAACAENSGTLPGATLARPMDRGDFAALLLDVMRDYSHSEVAMINRGAVSPRSGWPIEGGISRLRVSAALPFDNYLRVASIPGATLKKLALSPAASAFYFRGVTVVDGAVKVNGRTIDESVQYSLVTIDFVADGGDGGVGDPAVHFVQAGTFSLREIFLDWLGVPHGEDVTTAPVDPAQRTRWTLHYSLDVSASAVNVSNPNTTVLSDAQLSRNSSLTARGETMFSADAHHPAYTLENSLRLLYGATYVMPEGMPATLNETADLITGRSTAVYRRLFNEHPHWYEPLPYVDVYAESEFSVPETRTYRHLELRPTVGERLQINSNFSLYGGVGVSWEALARPEQLDPPGPTVVPVLVAGWQLRPSTLFRINGRSADAETTMDVAWRDPWGTAGFLMRFHSKLSIPVVASVSVTIGFDLFGRYAQYFDGNGMRVGAFGIAADTFVGIKVAYAQAFQAFSF